MSKTTKKTSKSEGLSIWSKWLDDRSNLEIVEWLRAYADSIDPNFANSIETISPRIAQKIRAAANDIERLRKLFGDSERLGGRFKETVDESCERMGGMRIELDEAIRERDEARRSACTYVSGTYKKNVVTIERTAAMAEAARRGWDCFMEKTP